MTYEKIINFDLDGTIADLYGVDNWLDYLINSDPFPYAKAKPLINMNVLARKLNKLQKQGFEINVVSWLSKNSTKDYDKAVIKAKKSWLKQHLKSVHFDNIFIVPYGTPKHEVSSGILFDDEEPNRTNWNSIENNYAFDVHDIFNTLKMFELRGV